MCNMWKLSDKQNKYFHNIVSISSGLPRGEASLQLKLLYKVSKHVKNRPAGNYVHEFLINITNSALQDIDIYVLLQSLTSN